MQGCRKKKGKEIKDKETKIQKKRKKKIRRKIPDVGCWENETSDLIINERRITQET